MSAGDNKEEVKRWLDEEKLEDFLTILRNEGEDYAYIDGVREGYYLQDTLSTNGLEDYLDKLRDEVTYFSFVDGVEDGYNLLRSEIGEKLKDEKRKDE